MCRPLGHLSMLNPPRFALNFHAMFAPWNCRTHITFAKLSQVVPVIEAGSSLHVLRALAFLVLGGSHDLLLGMPEDVFHNFLSNIR